jgi:hypothetical protein
MQQQFLRSKHTVSYFLEVKQMKVTVSLSAETLTVSDGGAEIYRCPATCKVRSLANGQRRTYEVIKSIPTDKPYDPRQFPKGAWRITGVDSYAAKINPSSFKTYGSYKFITDASQPVKVWRLDADGDYLSETQEVVTDSGYRIHSGVSKTTLGCIRLDEQYLSKLNELLWPVLKSTSVELEVL